ncbi:hypothetical protein L9F63_017856, partial [Diploptera punctata]
ENVNKLNLFDKQYQSLYMCGLFTPESIKGSLWKIALYRSYKYLNLMTVTVLLVMVLIPVFQFSEDSALVFDIMYQFFGFTYTVTNAYFWVFNQNRLADLFDTFEVKFMPYIKNLGLFKNLSDLEAIMKHYNKILSIVYMVFVFDFLIWVVVPFLTWALETSDDYKYTNSTEYFKYLCFKTWIPEHGTEMPLYTFVFIHQAMSGYFIIANFMTGAMIVFSLIHHTTTHFKLLISAFNNIDELFPLSEEEEAVITIPKRRINSKQVSVNVVNNVEDEYHTFESSSREITWGNKSDDVFLYVVECVKYHQHLLE